jgi:predicted enzyme related to lactoylglutathione lyase
MGAARFVRYELRTTTVDEARAFYAELLGGDLWGDDVGIAPLPDQALARGARPHWLGHLGVGDVDGTVNRLVALGAQQLGPTVRGASASHAIVRDPFGAVVALNSTTAPPHRDRVANLEEKLAVVRARGGLVLEPMQTANGDWVAPCDDAQGAAFALLQPGRG